MIPLKWIICLTICRIAGARLFYVYSLYVAMAMVFIVLASTAFYEFGSCRPIQCAAELRMPSQLLHTDAEL